MADPLSIASMVLEVADVLKRLYGYGQQVKGAQKEKIRASPLNGSRQES